MFAAAYLPPQSNSIDLYATKLLDSDVTSRLFVSTGLDDAQKFECVLKLFLNIDLPENIGNDLESLTNFVILVSVFNTTSIML